MQGERAEEEGTWGMLIFNVGAGKKRIQNGICRAQSQGGKLHCRQR